MEKLTINNLIRVLKLKLREVAEYTIEKEDNLGFQNDLQQQIIEILVSVHYSNCASTGLEYQKPYL